MNDPRPAPRPERREEPGRGGAAESVGAILGRLLPEVRPAERRRRSAVAEAWHRVAGDQLGEDTRASTLQRGVLTVEVRSPGLLAELQGFRREELLSRLLAAEPSGRITGLRFRPGVF